MAKNKIETNKEEFFDGTEENNIINNISKDNFIFWLNENGFDGVYLKKFFQEKRISSVEQNRFNIVLRKCKKELSVSIIDMILYLESPINRLKKIISTLDESTRHILKHELAGKYKEDYLEKLGEQLTYHCKTKERG